MKQNVKIEPFSRNTAPKYKTPSKFTNQKASPRFREKPQRRKRESFYLKKFGGEEK